MDKKKIISFYLLSGVHLLMGDILSIYLSIYLLAKREK